MTEIHVAPTPGKDSKSLIRNQQSNNDYLEAALDYEDEVQISTNFEEYLSQSFPTDLCFDQLNRSTESIVSNNFYSTFQKRRADQ